MTIAVTANVTDVPDTNGESSLVEKVLICIVKAFFIIMALAGNSLVCVVLVTDRKLKQRNSNRVLFSLAVADLLVGSSVMTADLINGAMEDWRFGAIPCLFWRCMDVTCCTASILHLCVVCVDRYLQITKPMHHEMMMTKTTINMIIVIVWAISFLTGFAPVRLGEDIRVEKVPPGNSHLCIFDMSFTFALTSSLVSFYIPAIMIVLLYMKIFMLTRYHVRDIRHKTARVEVSKSGVGMVSKLSKAPQLVLNFKATLTLGTIVGMFLICWFPFFVINILFAKCPDCVTTLQFDIVTWLGWTNSCVNPIIYSLLNTDIRRAMFHLRSFKVSGFSTTGLATDKQYPRESSRESDVPSCNERNLNQADKVHALGSTAYHLQNLGSSSLLGDISEETEMTGLGKATGQTGSCLNPRENLMQILSEQRLFHSHNVSMDEMTPQSNRSLLNTAGWPDEIPKTMSTSW